jgi:hypothetical protein
MNKAIYAIQIIIAGIMEMKKHLRLKWLSITAENITSASIRTDSTIRCTGSFFFIFPSPF